MDIGKRISELRTDNDLTQRQLAAKSGISRQATISDIESGRREPTASEICGIAEALSTSAHYLITGTDPDNITLAENTGLSNDTIIALCEYRKKDPEKSMRIAALFHALVSHEKTCLQLSDYLYLQYDAFSGMLDEDKEFLRSLYDESSLREMLYFTNLEPVARLRVMDLLKELREEIQNGKY